MKRFIITLPAGRQAHCNSEIEMTHCVIGKRSLEFERPSDDLLQRAQIIGAIPEEKRLTAEERILIQRYAFKGAHGHYALKALAWAESEDAAVALKARFSEPEWDQESLTIMRARRVTYGG